MQKIAVTLTSFCDYNNTPLELLRKAGYEVMSNPYKRKVNSEEFIEIVSNTVGLVAGTEKIGRNELVLLPSLRVISRCGVGMDSIDLNAAADMGIKVYNTPDAPTLAVAELTVGLMLALLRQISWMDRELRRGIWKKRMGNLLHGKKVGVIGFGRIGQRVAGLLDPFGVDVAYHDIQKKDSNTFYKAMPLEKLLRWADVITLHCTPVEGKAVLGETELQMMKEDAWLLNVSRGGLVDELALCTALQEGHLAGAALDVFEREPYTGPLSRLDNVILTPHIGSYARESRIEMEIEAVRNLIKGLEEL